MRSERIISVLAAGTMLAASAGASAAPNGNISEHLLFGINFSENSSEAYKGMAAVNGALQFEEENGVGAAVFGKDKTYIEAKKADGTSLLTGLDSFTVSYRAKTNAGPTWWLYAAPDTTVPVYGKEKYIGMLDTGALMTGERYNNAGARSDALSFKYDGGWHDIDIVIGKKSSTLYVDGTAVDSIESAVDVAELMGDDSVFYIGKAMWGEYANGALERYEVYDFAPEIDLDKTKITENIDLPSASEDKDGYGVSWSSSDTSLLENDGTVHRPKSGQYPVTLTAVVTYGTHVLERSFDVIVCGEEYSDFTLDISTEKGVDIQPNMYGLFFEDINFAADGGLYAEMVENRSFEEIMHDSEDGGTKEHTQNEPGYKWSAVEGSVSYDSNGEPLAENNTHYMTLNGKSVKNSAYDGMYVEKGKKYNISLYARMGDYDGGIVAKTVKDGTIGFSVRMTADNIVQSEYSKNGWVKYAASVTAENTVRYSDFILELDESASVDFDVISVMPDDAVCGLFRADLAQKLKALNPGFLRFPGGCIIEGWDLDNAYNWKDSVGAIENRKQNWNRWATTNPYNQYNQTYGLGYYEYFILCEYLGCDPVPVQNVGMACEYQGGSQVNGYQAVPVYKEGTDEYTDEFYSYIQDTLDLIEFANGTDFESSEWARLRRDMGHPEPFGLEMIGIGNEQWEMGTNNWYKRYEAFEKEIHAVYPDIKLIGTSGPAKDGTDFENAWSWIRENKAGNPDFVHAVDEHYYVSTSWFYENDVRYDDYDRDTKVFAGEYAAWTSLAGEAEKRNNLDSALAEAAFMTGLERNADVVYMASYAPLFARVGYTQWNPDLIWFDDASSYESPDYWVQYMYMNNNGTYTLSSTVGNALSKVYQTVSFDETTGDIIIKLVNPTKETETAAISFDDAFGITGIAEAQVLTGENRSDFNSISEPDKIKEPVYEQLTGITENYSYTVPPLSFAVLRVKTSTAQPADTMAFEDVSEGDWYYDDVRYAWANGLMNGVTDTLFSPNVSISRGECVTVLHRIENEPSAGGCKFEDVQADSYCADAVAWASENNLVEGYSETEFKPDSAITREQMAAILYRYASLKDDVKTAVMPEYTDAADVSDWARDAVAWAGENGIMTGNSDGSFAPAAQTTRAEAAAVFGRINKKYAD